MISQNGMASEVPQSPTREHAEAISQALVLKEDDCGVHYDNIYNWGTVNGKGLVYGERERATCSVR